MANSIKMLARQRVLQAVVYLQGNHGGKVYGAVVFLYGGAGKLGQRAGSALSEWPARSSFFRQCTGGKGRVRLCALFVQAKVATGNGCAVQHAVFFRHQRLGGACGTRGMQEKAGVGANHCCKNSTSSLCWAERWATSGRVAPQKALAG